MEMTGQTVLRKACQSKQGEETPCSSFLSTQMEGKIPHPYMAHAQPQRGTSGLRPSGFVSEGAHNTSVTLATQTVH